MPFREKSAWIALVTTAVVYGIYFSRIAPGLLSGPGGLPDAVGAFIATVIVLVVLQIILHVAAAALAPREAQAARDERETLIELRALRAAFYVSQVGAVGVVAAVLWRGDAAFIGNVVLLCMVAAELTRAGATVLDYRRGAA